MASDCAGYSHDDTILVKDGIITTIGDLHFCRMRASTAVTIIDLMGRIILPGFTDTHTHFVEHAKNLLFLDLSECCSIEDVKTTAVRYIDNHRTLPEWILGGGWDINKIDVPALIHRRLLDELFPKVPVALYSKDYHAKWCNSLALQICGVNRDSIVPSGGAVAIDPSGEPTGLLYESAVECIDKHVVQPSNHEVTQATRTRLSEMYRMGLTGFHFMEGAASASILRSLLESGDLFRCCWHFPYEELDNMIENCMESYTHLGQLTIGGVKLFADGALGSRTAAMFNPYPDNGGTGIIRYSENELQSIINKASDHNISCTVHAIGDRAVQMVASAFLQRKLNNPNENLGHRMEHAQCVSPEDIRMIAKSGLYCALQPVHLANDIPMVEEQWHAVKDRSYPWRDIVSASIPYGFGSDVPIETNNPFIGIYCSTQRKYRNDPKQPSWHPEQAVGLMDALYGYTQGAARGSHEEQLRGTIETGKQADLIVLDDWTKEDPEYWLNCQSRLTMIAGSIVHNDL